MRAVSGCAPTLQASGKRSGFLPKVGTDPVRLFSMRPVDPCYAKTPFSVRRFILFSLLLLTLCPRQSPLVYLLGRPSFWFSTRFCPLLHRLYHSLNLQPLPRSTALFVYVPGGPPSDVASCLWAYRLHHHAVRRGDASAETSPKVTRILGCCQRQKHATFRHHLVRVLWRSSVSAASHQ